MQNRDIPHRYSHLFLLVGFLFLIFSLFLSGCASSDVSRDAASNVDLGVQNARDLTSGSGNIGDSYQNSSQTVKGAILGGTAGAVAGALASGVGFIPGTATGAVLGASYGSYIDSNTSLDDQLKNRGVNVIELGDQILVFMPSARIFEPWTARIKPQAYSTLKLVSAYVNNFTKMLVKISVYTDNTGSKEVDLSLSEQQAESVERFLVASGIHARVLYAAGYGGTRLVTKNTGDWDTDNYRIEITLEKLYV